MGAQEAQTEPQTKQTGHRHAADLETLPALYAYQLKPNTIDRDLFSTCKMQIEQLIFLICKDSVFYFLQNIKANAYIIL